VAAQHFIESKDVTAAILKLWRKIKNPTLSVNVYSHGEHFWWLHPCPFWNDGAL